MSDPDAQDLLAIRRKRLQFRAQHRGIREMDIVLGGFAARHIGSLTASELDCFETLLGENDQELLAWFTCQAEVPVRIDQELFARIRTDAARSGS